MTEMNDSHINVLDRVLPILANNMRKWKALLQLQTVDKHRLPLHFFPSTSEEAKDKESGDDEDEGGRVCRCQQRTNGVRGARSNRCQRIECLNRG